MKHNSRSLSHGLLRRARRSPATIFSANVKTQRSRRMKNRGTRDIRRQLFIVLHYLACVRSVYSSIARNSKSLSATFLPCCMIKTSTKKKKKNVGPILTRRHEGIIKRCTFSVNCCGRDDEILLYLVTFCVVMEKKSVSPSSGRCHHGY